MYISNGSVTIDSTKCHWVDIFLFCIFFFFFLRWRGGAGFWLFSDAAVFVLFMNVLSDLLEGLNFPPLSLSASLYDRDFVGKKNSRRSYAIFSGLYISFVDFLTRIYWE